MIKQPARPNSGGYRSYEGSVVARIRFIRQAQELGFSLREIMELLSLRADPAADCSDVQAQAIAKRREVDRKITQLQQMRAALDTLISSCPGEGALRRCTIIDAFAGHHDGKADRSKIGEDELLRDPHGQTVEGATMKTTTLKIRGMHCDGCARTIAAIVSAEPGVQKAAVSFDTQQARILFDPKATSEARLAKAVQKAGYAVIGQPS